MLAEEGRERKNKSGNNLSAKISPELYRHLTVRATGRCVCMFLDINSDFSHTDLFLRVFKFSISVVCRNVYFKQNISFYVGTHIKHLQDEQRRGYVNSSILVYIYTCVCVSVLNLSYCESLPLSLLLSLCAHCFFLLNISYCDRSETSGS